MNKKVTALIGAGMVAKTHVSACAGASNRLRLKGISSRGRDRANALAAQASTMMDSPVMVYGSIEALAKDSELDFAIVATPPNVREDVIAPLVAAGKHILLEKPIGRTLAESREIVAMCRNAGVILGVVFQHRAREASISAMNLIREGQLGALGVVEIDVPWWREQSYYDEPGRGTYSRDGGGVLISQAIHTIDLGLHLTGPVRSVLAMASTSRFHKMESEDFVVAGLEFENGASGSLKASTASFPGRTESITLHYENASLHLEAGQLQVSWRDGKVETLGEPASTGGGADPMAFTHEWHQRILENFVDALNHDGDLLASGEQALVAHELIDATIRSAQCGKIQYLS
ncbi:MAG: Gfo/Idh/MocA family protein [Granulosicoccus sp.]